MSLIQMWDLNGKKIDLEYYGLRGLKLDVPSPSYNVAREDIPGRVGTINLGKDLMPRHLSAEFLFKSRGYEDSLLQRDSAYSLFSKGVSFYIGESKQQGKRWLVECTDQWITERINNWMMTTIISMVAELGMAESVGTTLDPFTFDANLWQVGQGLIAEELKYKHSTNTFSIYNAGEKIDPRSLPLKITYQGASNNLEISNLTTGDTWKYTGTSNSNDKIILDGIRSTRNNLSILRNTNKRLISLNPGWNEFKLNGTGGSFEIQFDFRFYYL